MLALEAASFWWETVVVAVTMSDNRQMSDKCRGGRNKLSNVRGFRILRPGKALTFFNNTNCTYFLDEKKKVQLSLSRNLFFENTRKKVSVNKYS